MKPERVQLSRQKGWRMPPDTVKVDRSTAWGNPFTPTMVCASSGGKQFKQGEPIGVAGAVAAFRTSWETKLRRTPDEAAAQLATIRGKHLACWCKPGEPCHADVLLELANREPQQPVQLTRRQVEGMDSTMQPLDGLAGA